MSLPAAFELPVIPVARLRLEAVAETPLHLPGYAGSALRGAFGHALRRLACMTRQKTCTGCPLRQTCPYAVIFETLPPPQPAGRLERLNEAPRPYVIEAPTDGQRSWQVGETLVFHLVLAARALQQLPLILLAWQRALQQGLGPETRRGCSRLARVWQTGLPEGDYCLLDTAQGISQPLLPLPPVPPLPEKVRQGLTLRLVTPLRLQQEGKILPASQITLRHLLRALFRRQHLLAQCHGTLPASMEPDMPSLLAAAQAITDEKHLYWQDWKRHSSRQQQAMTLGGLLGDWHLQGDLAPVWPLLWQGQALHAGKEAVFGLGGYVLLPDGEETGGSATGQAE